MKKPIQLLLVILFFICSIAQSSMANRLEDKYDVKFYFLDLDIQKTTTSISGNVLIKVNSLVSNLDTFSLELAANLTVDSVLGSVNNSQFQICNFQHPQKIVNVLLPSIATQNQVVQVKIFYHGSPTVSNGLLGQFNSGFFQQSVGGNNGQHKFSASPPYNSASWFPCKQDLKDKADSSWFFITTNSADRGLSNGILTNTVDLGNGKKRWEWKSKYPIDFYLISFVVNSATETIDYWHPQGRTDSLLLTYYGYVPTNVKSILQLYSDKFGLYPFYNEKLGIANVDLGGGIENQTMIVLGASFGGFEPHEIGHMWFGDNVSCSSWKDIILSEGFARWTESVYDEFTSASPNTARMSHFTDNTTTSTVYGATMDTTSVNGVFLNSALYYDKAAMVINSLRFQINNDDLFFLGLRNYQTQFGGRSATVNDLKVVMETTTGISLTDFFNQWYYKGGAPTFNIVWTQNNGQLYLRINETTNSTSNPLYKTPLELKIIRTEGDTIIRLDILENTSNFSFYCPGTITDFVVDPNQWITNGVGTKTQDSTLAISKISDLDAVKIFPNPALEYFTISSTNIDIQKIVIISLSGQIEKTIAINNKSNKIDVSDLKDGVHIVKLITKSGERIVRILKE